MDPARSRRRGRLGIATAALVAAFAAGAPAADAATQLGSWTTAGEHAFTVPAGVDEITVTAVGARGGGEYTYAVGGFGAYVQATLPVTAGQTLYAVVGGNGAYGIIGADYNDAASGGGASDIRSIAVGQPNTLNSRLLVAGGGGGAGRGTYDGSTSVTGMVPGGNAGETGGQLSGGRGGAPGTTAAGGAGGAATTSGYPAASGSAGGFGFGGSGGDSGSTLTRGNGELGGYNGGGPGGGAHQGGDVSASGPGGGGGGGYYGGGGGGGGYNPDSGGGGGGGGSSYVVPGSSGVSITPASSGPSITVTYDVPAPRAVTTPASGLTPTGAQLNGTVDPQGEATTYSFQYGTTAAYGSTLAGGTVAAGSASSVVSAALSGLAPNTTYHFRLVATSSGGTVNGGDQTFTTPSRPPAQIDLDLGQAAAPDPVRVGDDLTYTLTVENTSATDDATGVTVTDPLAGDATFVSASATQGACSGVATVSCALGTLAAGATATVTIVVEPTETGELVNVAQVGGDQLDPVSTNDAATSRVEVRDAPIVATGSVSDLAPRSATLNGLVTPQREATTYRFEYGPTSGYGSTTAGASAGAAVTASSVTQALTGLEPERTYHYRIVATNATGTTTGADRTFTTPAAPVPAAPAAPAASASAQPPAPSGGPAPSAAGSSTAASQGRLAPGLTLRIARTTDRRAPFRFAFRGELQLPRGIAAGEGCRGRVQVVVKSGTRTVAARSTYLGGRCSWTRSVTFRDPKRLSASGRGRLRVQVRFLGNRLVASRRLAARTLTYGG